MVIYLLNEATIVGQVISLSTDTRTNVWQLRPVSKVSKSLFLFATYVVFLIVICCKVFVVFLIVVRLLGNLQVTRWAD